MFPTKKDEGVEDGAKRGQKVGSMGDVFGRDRLQSSYFIRRVRDDAAALAAVLQSTEEQLKTMSETCDALPFTKLGDGVKSSVRYRVGLFPECRNRQTLKNTSQINVSRFGSMADFLSTEAMDDTLPRRQGWRRARLGVLGVHTTTGGRHRGCLVTYEPNP